MMLEPIQYLLGGFSGGLVGFTLGLVGGGGSILAVPLMVYLVGVPSAHVAIGTSAVAVAVNAALNLVSHIRAGHVKWRCAAVFTLAGVTGHHRIQCRPDAHSQRIQTLHAGHLYPRRVRHP